jgi:GPH family glycoside/pentoside/hexuronide:cation symporter
MALLVFRVFLRKDATHPLGVLYRHGYERFGLVAALVMLVTILVSAFGTHGRGAALIQRARERISLADQVRQMMTTLSNRSFVSLTVAGIFGGVAGGLVGGLELYIASYFWELSSREISYFAILGFVCAILAVAAAPAVAKRMDKKRATITLLCMSLVGVFPMPLRLVGLMPPNHSFALLAILLIEAFIQNTLSIMALIIASSMMADVVEDVAVSSGQYSAGLLFAANGLVQKCVLGIGTFAAGLLLEFVHFPQGATQSHVDPAVLRHLALVFVPLTAGCGAIGIACLTFYRIDRVGHQRNLDILRDAAAATENRGVEGVEV